MIDGLIYIPNFITKNEQDSLISEIDSRDWDLSLKRRTQHYGYRYDYTKKKIDKSLHLGELPDFLNKYSESLRGWFEKSPDQVIINEYYPGQGISRHTDCVPCFSNVVASLSLNSTCIMDFEQWGSSKKKSFLLEPLSLLILDGEARYRWMHAIQPRQEDIWNDKILPRERRVSLTFRKVILDAN